MRALVLISLLLLAYQAYGAQSDANARLTESARTLNSGAQETLGISLRHLSLLLQASPNEFFSKERLEKNGSWDLLKELESKGFVTVKVSENLPYNSSAIGGPVVSYTVTPKGEAVLLGIGGK